jgi:hypothetical protein
MFKSLLLLILTFLLMMGSFSTHAKDWKEYTSENFTIISDQNAAMVKKRIHELEAYRASALLFLGLENKKDSTPAKMVIFDSEREFRLLTGKNSNVAGYYKQTLNGPVMVLSRSRKQESDGEENLVLFHEFIHYLIRERSSMVYPHWYEEGLCDLLAATVIKDGKAFIGQSNTWRHWAVMTRDFRTSTEKLVSTHPADRDAEYYRSLYNSGWLITHYLLLGKLQGAPNYTEGLSKYLQAFSNGDASLETFEKSLGVTAEDLDKALRKYAEDKEIVGISIPVSEYNAGISERTLSQVESVYYRADLLEYAGKEIKAQHFLRKVKPSDDKYYPRVLSKLAIYEGHDKEFDSALRLLDQAFGVSKNDYQVLVDAAHLYADYIDELKPKEPWDEKVQSLYVQGLAFAKSAYEHPNKTIEAPRYLREYYHLKHDTLGVVKMYMEQYAYTPNNIELNKEIGNYLARTGKPRLALPFLQKVVAFSHDEDDIEEAARLIDRINKGEKILPEET